MPELYPDQIAAFLTHRFGSGIERIERIGHGEWSQAFSFLQDGVPFVVRFSALDEDFLKDRQVMDAASGDLPVPTIVDLGEAFGGYYAISERASGEFLDVLDGPGLQRTLPSLFNTLDGIRLVDISPSTGYGLWGVTGNAPHATWREALLDVADDSPTKRTFGWRQRLAESTIGLEPFAAAFGRLQSLVELCPEQRHLVHADLLNFNVLIANDRVSAVLDWGSAEYGDFVFDVAWFSFWQPWYPAWAQIDFASAAAQHYASIGLDVPNFAERLQCYETHIGLDGQAYNAFKGRFGNVEAIARRTLERAGL